MRLRRQDVGGGNTSFLRDTGSGDSFTVTDTKEVARAYIEIKSGTTVNNLTFYPMIRFADASAGYTPWGTESGSTSFTTDEETKEIVGIPGKETIVWSPSGKVMVQYAADTKSYIAERMLAVYNLLKKVVFENEDGPQSLAALYATLFPE